MFPSTPARRILYTAPKVLYLATLIILCILFANLKYRTPTFESPDSRILQRIFANVHKLPINNIALASAEGVCPTNFVSAPYGSWDGTAAGCMCATLLNRTCTESDTGCSDVAAVPSQPVRQWKNTALCIQRVSATFSPDSSSNTCDAGQTLCNAGVCVPEAENCPLTDIQIVALTTVSPDTATYTEIPLNDGASKIIFSVAPAEYPVTDIDVSFYDEPCKDPLMQPNSNEGTVYPLSVFPENGCKGGGPIDHLEHIDTMLMTTLVTENGFDTAVKKAPNYWSYISDETAYLVGLRQYRVKSDNSLCGKTQPEVFTELSKYENQFVDSTHAILIAALVIMSILFFTILIELCLRLRSNEEETHFLKYAAYGNFFLLFVACILFIVAGSFAARAKVHLADDIKNFKGLGRSECFYQTEVNYMLRLFQAYITDLYAQIWLGIILLILASTGMLVAIILFIIDSCAGGRNMNPVSFYRSIGNSSSRRGNYSRNGTKRGEPQKKVGNIELLFKQ